jgi:hypothetical protein
MLVPISFEKYKNIKMNKKAYRLLTDKIMLKIAELSNTKYFIFNGFSHSI